MAVLKSSLILSLIDNVSGPARRISGVMAGFQKQQLGMLSALRGAGGLLALGAGYLGVTQGIGATAGAAIEFEEAFANVRKVLNGSDEQLDGIRAQIIGMSKELPIAAGGIAEIYAAAGQANIPMADLSKFSEMVAKVSTAWEVPVAETGQALAEIKNQLNLGVTEVGLFADSLNHLSNNTAANAPRLLEYTKRVAANGEMFGFSAQETLAFGGAMISAGAESEVAATSFRNMGRALTKGTEATKMQRTAFKRLGLDSVKTAKNMQKDALGTTLDVIERIQKLPEWERISMASALFGDEARALMPAINNSTELRRQLGLVGDQANYAGSAFKEYTIRASTVGNVLSILRNKFADVFRAMGDKMLPGIKEAALGIGDILDSLGERATVFDQMGAAFKGFMQGMGADGGIRSVINDLGDLLFGAADGSAAADKIGRIFVKFREWGTAVRELTSAIAANPLVKFFGDLAPYGMQIMLWGVGIAMLAGTIRKLAAALMFLSGASTILAALKAVGSIADLVSGGTFPKGGGNGKGGGGTPAVPVGWWAGAGAWLKGLSLAGAPAAAAGALSSTPGDTYEEQVKYQKQYREGLERILGLNKDESGTSPWSRFWLGDAAKPGYSFRDSNSFKNPSGVEPSASSGVDINTLRAAMAPQGVQQVTVTNPQAPNVTVHAPITITGVADGAAAGSAAASQLGSEVKSAVESGYLDSQ